VRGAQRKEGIFPRFEKECVFSENEVEKKKPPASSLQKKKKGRPAGCEEVPSTKRFEVTWKGDSANHAWSSGEGEEKASASQRWAVEGKEASPGNKGRKKRSTKKFLTAPRGIIKKKKALARKGKEGRSQWRHVRFDRHRGCS